MKRRKIIFVLFFLTFSFISKAQTVDSVVAEQVGDLIKIRYRILNSSSDQLFKVTILCSINGGLKSELNNTFGDLGEVRGGKTEYTIVWDVLKDVDELQSAEFFVRAEMIKEKDPPVVIYQVEPQPVKKKDYASHLFFVYAGSPNNGNLFGLRYGYMKKFGVSVHSSFGLKIEGTGWNTNIYPLMYSGFDFTTRLLSMGKTQIYLLTGVAAAYNQGKEDTEPYTYPYSLFFPGFDLGTIIDIGRFTSSLHIGGFPKIYNQKDIRPDFGILIGAGIGFRF